MKKVQFKVSARTAMLIGRENVANAQGAIIELVKNCYDADSSFCALIFDVKYNDIPTSLANQEFDRLSKLSNLLESCYLKKGLKYRLKGNILTNPHLGRELKKFFKSLCSIYIIDNGEGMNERIIEESWMIIGTSNKLTNYKSSNGRIQTGAKGIGRFALDRLGKNATMYTKKEHSEMGIKWEVDWTDFEKDGISLNEVNAELVEVERESIQNVIFGIPEVKKFNRQGLFDEWDNHGTIIQISNLRDNWTDEKIERIFSDLKVLAPSEESGEFNIHVFSTEKSQKYGKVSGSVCDDFDYKLEAEVYDEKVSIKLTRKELDLRLIKQQEKEEIFALPLFQKTPFDLKTFEIGAFIKTYKINEFCPDLLHKIKNSDFGKIGPFKIILYFMKRSFVPSENKYYFKYFNGRDRQTWFDTFGGIRIFRDNFRVRPYGEIEGNAFDWLQIGRRKSESPSNPEHPSAKWRVGPKEISGIVKISRVDNSVFKDKSNREGLQENIHFGLLKKFIIRLIEEIEDDRQKIIRSLSGYYRSKTKKEQLQIKSNKIANTIKTKKERGIRLSEDDKEKEVLIHRIKTIEQTMGEINDERKLLRALASTGLIVTSFAHELNNLKVKLLRRHKILSTTLTEIFSEEDFQENFYSGYNNPLELIEHMKNEDEQLVNWLNFAVFSIKKDKRRKKDIKIVTYLDKLKKNWIKLLDERHVNFEIKQVSVYDTLAIKGFEIDLDSIFNNLITNSLDAFSRDGFNENTRNISITFRLIPQKLRMLINYKDSGPGLFPDIKDLDKIFDPFFTTKANGTGIGLWIVKNILLDYNSTIEVVNPRPGIELEMKVPVQFINMPSIDLKKVRSKKKK